jgi:DNA-binding transcriptional ArsR family regulator
MLYKKIMVLIAKRFYTHSALTLIRQMFMKTVKTITDPEAFKVLADGSRRKILFLLRAKEMTVSQIAEQLSLTPQTVYHHIKRLLEGDMVEVSREVRVDHIIESYYQATAEVFYFTLGESSHSKKAIEETTEAALKALVRLGFKLNYDKKAISELAELRMEMHDCCGAKEYEDAISKLDNVDLLTQEDVQEYAGILSMSAEEIETQEELQKKFRNRLRALIKK